MTQQSLTNISTAILNRMAEQRKQFPQYSTWHEAETVIEVKIRRASELLNKIINVEPLNIGSLPKALKRSAIEDLTKGLEQLMNQPAQPLPKLEPSIEFPSQAAFIDVAAHCLLAISECPSQKLIWAKSFDELFSVICDNAHLEEAYAVNGIQYMVDECIIANLEAFKHSSNQTRGIPEAALYTIAAHCILLINHLEFHFHPMFTIQIPQEN